LPSLSWVLRLVKGSREGTCRRSVWQQEDQIRPLRRVAVVVLLLVGWFSLLRRPALEVPSPPAVVHENAPPSMPADALDGMMESFNKAHDGLGETMRNLQQAQAREAEERRRRDAEFGKSNDARPAK
jgi:hypothetical protein